jgi:Zn-dependent protease with chaperone function
MSETRSIAGRAALAIVLMVGFYGLALAVAGGLVWLPWAARRASHALQLKLALFCLAGAFIILKSIVPRRDRFEPPGPRLTPEEQPRLFAEVGGVAQATGQAMPAEVYLIPDVNAWVSQRGGLMGFGSRRVMGLGLPLLQALSVPQLRAVLAHEFGHFHGGDVKIGPWIYKTRQALVRTLQGLAQHSGLLAKPFELYALVFFRITHAVSRHQELLADALAARVAGPGALAGGLKASHAAGLAFAPYWTQDVSPVLEAGFVPPLAGGFARFIEQPRIAEGLREAVDDEARGGRHDPYDTHPSLRERLAALAGNEALPTHGSEPRALSLLERVDALEGRLAGMLVGGGSQVLLPLAWDDVGVRVLLPTWRAFLRKQAHALSGLTPGTLESLDWAALGRKVALRATPDDVDPLLLADYAVGSGVALALSQAGFTVDAPPGSSVALVRGASRFEPFSLRQRLAMGTAEVAAWRSFCAETAIGEIDLGRLAQQKVEG